MHIRNHLNGDLKAGPKHVFSLNAGDITNGLYKIIDNNGDQIIVHNSFISDAEAGDKRVADKICYLASNFGILCFAKVRFYCD